MAETDYSQCPEDHKKPLFHICQLFHYSQIAPLANARDAQCCVISCTRTLRIVTYLLVWSTIRCPTGDYKWIQLEHFDINVVFSQGRRTACQWQIDQWTWKQDQLASGVLNWRLLHLSVQWIQQMPGDFKSRLRKVVSSSWTHDLIAQRTGIAAQVHNIDSNAALCSLITKILHLD